MPSRWEQSWNNSDPFLLPRYACPSAYAWLRARLPANPDARDSDPLGRRKVAEAIYESLLSVEIRYRREKLTDERGVQQAIRQPSELLDHPREGTCLDLTLLFCGLCISARLLPWIVVLKGHAFAAISLQHDWDQWMCAREEWSDFRFDDGRLRELTDEQRLRHYLDSSAERYLCIECTGVADTRGVMEGSLEAEAFGRTEKGTLTFDAAVKAGHEHVTNRRRRLEYAIDLAVAQRNCGIDPFDIPPPHFGAPRLRETCNLEYLVDRAPQAERLRSELSKAVERGARAPEIFVLPGDIDQGHSLFIDRLRFHELPEIRSSALPETVGPLVRFVQLPPASATDFDHVMRRSIRNALPNFDIVPTVPSWPEISAWCESYPGEIVFYSSFSVERDWRRDRSRRINAWIQAWRNCTVSGSGKAHPPIACLNIICEPRSPKGGLHNFRRWWDKRAVWRYLARIEAAVTAGSMPLGIGVTRLHDLAGVLEADVRDWHDDPRVAAFRSGRDLQPQIRSIFAASGTSSVPMEEMVAYLRSWLRECGAEWQ